MTGFRKRVLKCADDETAHLTGIAKPHFRFGRVHVDVNFLRRALEK